MTSSSASQISIGQVSTGHENTAQISSGQVSSGQVNVPQSGHIQSSLTQIGTPEDREVETRLLQGSLTQIGIGEIAILKTMAGQIGLTQVSSAEIATEQTSTVTIGFTKIDSLQISVDQLTTQTKSAEIPFSSSISQQQFLGSDSSAFHNFNLQNTTIPTWTEFLTGTTPFNLNIEITDLPTGQLAEANITGFDSNGRPTTGTFTLDHNANNLGWFIDPTPWDNTEFAPQNSDTFFRATPGSEAYGHYDLLTTVLHVREAFALANTRPPRRPHQRQPHLRQPHPNQPFGKQ
jgi:hypothetical protein